MRSTLGICMGALNSIIRQSNKADWAWAATTIRQVEEQRALIGLLPLPRDSLAKDVRPLANKERFRKISRERFVSDNFQRLQNDRGYTAVNIAALLAINGNYGMKPILAERECRGHSAQSLQRRRAPFLCWLGCLLRLQNRPVEAAPAALAVGR
jgi:hypothetical protein